MMISPEAYYEMCLKGKSRDEILTQIDSLKKEIGSLKRYLEDDTEEAKPVIFPSPLIRIRCNRGYLEMAKRTYEEAGGQYAPTRDEMRDQAFNEALPAVKRFTLEIGGFFQGQNKYIYTISGDQVLFAREHFPCRGPEDLKPAELPEAAPSAKEDFVSGLAELHMGEWKKNYDNPYVMDGTQWEIRIEYEDGRRPVESGGSNAYPYNFKELLELLGIDEEENEE